MIFIVIVLLFNLGFASGTKRITLAVTDIEGTSIGQSLSNAVSQVLLTTVLKQFGDRYDLLERSQMNAILKEHGFQQAVGSSDLESAVKMGQLLGVEQMIIGNIEKVGGTYLLTLKLVDIQTAKILNISAYKYAGEQDGLLDIEQAATLELFPKEEQKNRW